MFDLHYKPRLKQIECTLNCWRSRNVSIAGKICVVKTLLGLLPQLLYLFSALCIQIPSQYYKDLKATR